MSVYKYKDILAKAKGIKDSVEKNYDFIVTAKWSYYIAKALLQPNKDFNGIGFKEASKPNGTYISQYIPKKDYLDMCTRLVKYVEKNKQLPNNVAWRSYKVDIRLFTYIISYLLVHYDAEKKLKSKVNVSSKYFVKPTETTNVVYDYFVKQTGLKPKYLDDVCDWVRDKVTYQFYFDDQKSNKQVIDSKAGNCTDLLQFLVNMAKALGYDFEVIHTQCKQSGTGHVYGRFKKKTSSEWIVRDIACIADESRYCVWCEVPNGGYLLSKNPSWFMENLNR